MPRTGIWDCCGNTEHFSLYCESLTQRDTFRATLENEAQRHNDDEFFRQKRRVQLRSHIDKIQQRNIVNDNEVEAQRKAEMDDKKRRGVYNPDREAEKEKQRLKQLFNEQFRNMTEKERDLTNDKKILQHASDEERAFHAPVLVSWLMKSFHEEPTSLVGLNYVLTHCKTGEGCVLLVKHGVLDALKRVHYQYLAHGEMQLKIILILRQLLDCNFTREYLLTGKMETKTTEAGAYEYLLTAFYYLIICVSINRRDVHRIV